MRRFKVSSDGGFDNNAICSNSCEQNNQYSYLVNISKKLMDDMSTFNYLPQQGDRYSQRAKIQAENCDYLVADNMVALTENAYEAISLSYHQILLGLKYHHQIKF